MEPEQLEPSKDDHVADVELARRARAGDRRAIDAFVARMACVRKVLAYKNAQFGSPLETNELEDVIQNTLTAVWRKLESYEGRGSLEAWTYRFSYLELMAHLRRDRRFPGLLEDVKAGATVDPRPTSSATNARFEHLYNGLERLDPLTARIIRWKHIDLYTFEEIAARLDLSPNTAKTRYYRGMRKLRSLLGEAADPLLREREA